MPRLLLPLALALLALPAAAQPASGPAAPDGLMAADPPEERAMPEPVGGFDALVGEIEEQASADGARVNGRVVVQFVVDETGRVADAAVAEGVHPALDAAALRAVRAARFLPALRRGRAVRVELALPLTFDWPEAVTEAVAPRPPVGLL